MIRPKLVLCSLAAASLFSFRSSAGPIEPSAAIKLFQIEPGLAIELVASEPMIVDPVAISFDELGRMYVVEYRDYPNGPGNGKPNLSRIKLLEDTDGDGRMDRGHVFADNLSFAQGVMAWKGGILVTSWPYLMFLKDSDGDSRADIFERLFEVANQKTNPQLRMAHPRWGPDNWIYITNGLAGTVVSSAGNPDQKVTIGRHDFRFHPRTHEFEPETGFGQFGNTFDDWGNRFFCSNRNPVMYAIIPYQAIRRNPFAVITQGYDDVAPSGGDAKIYPIAETTTTAYSHTGTHTAACGVTVYRGDLLGPEYANNVFVCDPTGYLVTRSILRPHGVSFRAERARPKQDFLASTDTWFRPVSLSNGPDGGLYVVDMYRAVIEHPEYMVGYFSKEHIASLDFRAGDDRGRIYRIRRTGAKPRPYAPPKSTGDCVALLSDPNGWRRELGQRLVVERQATQAAGSLEKLIANADDPRARLQALWTLDGLARISPAILRQAVNDRDPRVQEHAIRIAASQLKADPGLLAVLQQHVKHDSARVRLQLTLAAGELNDSTTHDGRLALLTCGDTADQWIRRAVLCSCSNFAGAVLTFNINRFSFDPQTTVDRAELTIALAEIVGARGDEMELARAFNLLEGDNESTFSWWQAALLTGLGRGLERHRGGLGSTSLAGLLARPPKQLVAIAPVARKVIEGSIRVALDKQRPYRDRIGAIQLMAFLPVNQSRKAIAELLDPAEPADIHAACVDALRGAPEAATLLIDRWGQLSPRAQASSLDLLLQRGNTIRATLEAMAAGKINPAAVNLDDRTRLLNSGDKQIQALAQKLFGGAVSANRQAVAATYKKALTAKSDPVAGHKAFQKVCAACHRISGEGHNVGPDISDVRNKTKETLLSDIMDPNRSVEPRWVEYTVATQDGRVITGLLAGDSGPAILLRRSEGKEESIPRAQIESMRASGKSIMPEGVEKDLSVQEVADLLEFLKQQK